MVIFSTYAIFTTQLEFDPGFEAESKIIHYIQPNDMSSAFVRYIMQLSKYNCKKVDIKSREIKDCVFRNCFIPLCHWAHL